MKKRYFVIAMALFLVGYIVLLKGTEETLIVSTVQDDMEIIKNEKDSIIGLTNDIKDKAYQNKEELEILDGTLREKDIILIEKNKDIQEYIKKLKNLLLESEDMRKLADSARVDSEKIRRLYEQEKIEHLEDDEEDLKKNKELENKYKNLLEELEELKSLRDSSVTITDTVYKIDTVFYKSDEIKKIKLKDK